MTSTEPGEGRVPTSGHSESAKYRWNMVTAAPRAAGRHLQRRAAVLDSAPGLCQKPKGEKTNPFPTSRLPWLLPESPLPLSSSVFSPLKASSVMDGLLVRSLHWVVSLEMLGSLGDSPSARFPLDHINIQDGEINKLIKKRVVT